MKLERSESEAAMPRTPRRRLVPDVTLPYLVRMASCEMQLNYVWRVYVGKEK